jgi:hypothetical protein
MSKSWMKQKNIYIQGNIDEINRYFNKLLDYNKQCAEAVVRDLAVAIHSDLKTRSPVVTGNLKGNWNLEEIAGEIAYKIYNNTEYIWDVEFGHAASAGFIRKTIEDWKVKAPKFIEERTKAWIEKKRREV